MPLQTMSDPDLRAYAAEHLAYEIKMLILTRESLKQQPVDQFQNNLLVNSWGLALRNLLDFFFCPPKEDDVVARHYAPEWDHSFPTSLKTAKERTNKELAHLTMKRIAGEPPEKAWPVDGLSADLRPVIAEFLQQADERKLPPEVAALLRHI